MKSILVAARFLLAFLAGSLLTGARFWSPAPASALAPSTTFTVNTTLDTPNADASTGRCADAQGRCSLRAAVMVANFVGGTNTIILPAGIYTLTRPGYDDSALVGDLDIAASLTIQGAGSAVTTVDGNGAVTGDRVFKVLSTANAVTLSGMTIRNGSSLATGTGMLAGGGGLFTASPGSLTLSDVIFDSNTAVNGGGLEADLPNTGGSIVLDHVILRNNKAVNGGVGAGGGMFASFLSGLSTMDIHDSQVTGNSADGTGGGLEITGTDLAHWSIERSQINANTAAAGGGIGNFMPLTLTASRLSGNHATFDGGGIEAFSPLAISTSTLDTNSAGRYGGGIFDLGTGTSALYNDFDNISQSTLSGNSAADGGGIYHDGFINFNSVLTLTNSTVSGNSVFHSSATTGGDGGGIFLYDGQAQLFNVTVAFNMVHLGFPTPGPGIGGGLYIDNSSGTSVLTVENSIIAQNTRGNGIMVPTADDCYSVGTTGTLAFDLITSTTNCFITGTQQGNIIGQAPLLAPLYFDGGPTQTDALLAGSPAIDAGAITGCTGAGGAPITVDQRGRPRSDGAACDIGAFEYDPNAGLVFLPVVRGK